MITWANMDAEGKAKHAARKMITRANMDTEGKAKHAARNMITRANMDAEGKLLNIKRPPTVDCGMVDFLDRDRRSNSVAHRDSARVSNPPAGRILPRICTH